MEILPDARKTSPPRCARGSYEKSCENIYPISWNFFSLLFSFPSYPFSLDDKKIVSYLTFMYLLEFCRIYS